MIEKTIVTVLGLFLIILVNWYFFFPRRKEVSASFKESQLQEVEITVKGGYTPDVIVVKKGIPVRLNFYRNETADCSDTIVIGDFKIRKALPAFKTTSIEFTPDQTGEFDFTCGMGMLKGKLIVR